MLALLIEWLVRIYSGVIQKAIRKYLLATALLTIYWYVIKIIKWYFVDNETVATIHFPSGISVELKQSVPDSLIRTLVEASTYVK